MMKPSEFYEKYSSDRNLYETRAEDFAKITLPYAIRSDGADKSTTVPFARAQSFCGGLVNNLKSKMGLALLPPSTSSFRFAPSGDTLEEIYPSVDGQANPEKEALFRSLSAKTSEINNEIEVQQIRSPLFNMISQLLVVGSVVVEKLDKDGMIIHPLKSFAVKLNRRGMAMGICIVEKLYVLPDGITPKETKDDYELYTLVDYDSETNKWIMTQEIDGELVGKEQTFKDDMDLPFRYLGWQWAAGESYHRPYVEDYYDDMVQLNNLAELLTRGSLASAKVTWLVDERGGRTNKNEIAKSKTGAYLHGKKDDVTVVQAGKNFDFQPAMDREANLKRELSKLFLSNEAATRDAERVTAYEVQLMARELESSTLGGIYSAMALGFSKWLVHQIMKELDIDFKAMQVEILTGLDAIGRSQEAQKMDGFMNRVAQLGLTQYIDMKELLNRYASFDGINTIGLVKSDAEVKKEQKAQLEANAQATAQNSVAGKAGDVVADAAKQ